MEKGLGNLYKYIVGRKKNYPCTLICTQLYRVHIYIVTSLILISGCLKTYRKYISRKRREYRRARENILLFFFNGKLCNNANNIGSAFVVVVQR